MTHLAKFGPLAAFLNPILALSSLYVAFVLIGPAALGDPAVFIELARHNPTPLFIQDALKFASALIGLTLVIALFIRLRSTWAMGFGLLSILCLVANAILSLYATTQAANLSQGEQMNTMIGLLGMASIFLNGPWYLLNSLAGRRNGLLPQLSAILGLVMGALSLLPFLGIIVLALSIPWSVWIGLVLLKTPTQG